MAEKRPPLPLLLTANDLRSGISVYFDGGGWTPTIEAALIARDEAAAAALDDRIASDRAGTEVVDPFLVNVVLDPAGAPVPRHYRERSRIIGPSFRDDFGRNPQERAHVSL